jgi:hypothetical protein
MTLSISYPDVTSAMSKNEHRAFFAAVDLDNPADFANALKFISKSVALMNIRVIELRLVKHSERIANIKCEGFLISNEDQQ